MSTFMNHLFVLDEGAKLDKFKAFAKGGWLGIKGYGNAKLAQGAKALSSRGIGGDKLKNFAINRAKKAGNQGIEGMETLMPYKQFDDSVMAKYHQLKSMKYNHLL